MQEITRNKNGNGYDEFYITTDEGVFSISFEGTLDLYWFYNPKSNILKSSKTHTFTITKENYFLYEEFLKLYESIKNKKPYSNRIYSDEFDEEIIDDNGLFIDNKIQWHSDEFMYEYSSILTIEKVRDTFKVIFEKSKENENEFYLTYSVRIRNSGSRYHPYNIPFNTMYQRLKQYDPNNHQIHIEEYIYKEKQLIKK